MATDAAGFKAFLPEFASVSDQTITRWLSFVNTIICPGSFGSRADQAVYFLTAHYLSNELARVDAGAAGGDSGNATQGVTAYSVGDVSVTLESAKGSDPATYSGKISTELSTTEYGRIYLSLLVRTGRVITTTGMV